MGLWPTSGRCQYRILHRVERLSEWTKTEVESLWKEVPMAQFEPLSRNLTGMAEKRKDVPQSIQSLSWMEFETFTTKLTIRK
jgi:hypothetical protein